MFACGKAKDINYVKGMPNFIDLEHMPDMTFGRFIDSMSSKGYVPTWNSFKPSYGFKPSVRIVQLEVRNRTDTDTLIMPFTYDRETNETNLGVITINGKEEMGGKEVEKFFGLIPPEPQIEN